jgi:hypothetical protein
VENGALSGFSFSSLDAGPPTSDNEHMDSERMDSSVVKAVGFVHLHDSAYSLRAA